VIEMNMNPVKLVTICLVMIFLWAACGLSGGQPEAEKEQIRRFELSGDFKKIHSMYYSPILENGLWIYFGSNPIQLNFDTGEITELSVFLGAFPNLAPEHNILPDPSNPDLIWFFDSREGLMNYNILTGEKKVFGLSEAFNSPDKVFLYNMMPGKLLMATVPLGSEIFDQGRFYAFDSEANAFMPVSRLNGAAQQTVRPLAPFVKKLIAKPIIEEGRYKYAVAKGELQKIDTVNKQVYRSPLKDVRRMWDDPRGQALWVVADQDQLVRIDKHNNQDVFSLIPRQELAVRNGYVTTAEDILNIQKALKADNYEAIERMIREGVDVNMRVFAGEAPLLMYLLASEQPELARFIIEMEGCDVNASHRDGTTPVLLARLLGYHDLHMLLLEKGAREYELPGNPSIRLLPESQNFIIRLFKGGSGPEPIFEYFINKHISEVLPWDSNNEEEWKMEFHWGNVYQEWLEVMLNKQDIMNQYRLGQPVIILAENAFHGTSEAKIITVWDMQPGNVLNFNTILDPGVPDKWAVSTIKNQHPLNPQQTIITGETCWSDGNSSSIYFWIGLWTKPSSFKILGEWCVINWDPEEQEDDSAIASDIEAEFDYRFDPETLLLEFEEFFPNRGKKHLIRLKELIKE